MQHKVVIKKSDSTNPKAKRFIHLFVLAFLNFVNNPEIELVEVKERNTEQKGESEEILLESFGRKEEIR